MLALRIIVMALCALLVSQTSVALDDPQSTDSQNPEKQNPEKQSPEGQSPDKPATETSTDSSSKPTNPLPSTEKPASSETDAAAALLGRLTPEHLNAVGQMLDEDWKDRPEWGEMAVAIMKGDFMRPNVGWWKPGAKRYDWRWLRERLDTNKDNTIERAEFPKDLSQADKLFDRMDRDRDGQLKAADFDFTDSLAGNMAAMMGMNMSTMKNMMSNQLFSRLDKDSNGRITFEEVTEFFLDADSEDLGFLTPEDLRFAIDDPPLPPPDSAKAAEARPAAGPSTTSDAMRMFLNHELGWLGAGPNLNDPAPPFSLPTHDHKTVVHLADSLGKKPIVLIFGSFT